MKFRLPNISIKWIGLTVALLTVGIAWGLSDQWFPNIQLWAASQLAVAQKNTKTDKHVDEHEGHDHAGHDESMSLELSDQARRNIGLTDEFIREIKLESFTRAVTVPAMVVERPGQTDIKVVAPMTGIVTDVYAVKGEAVLPGTLLFKIRLTHEDLVQAQTVFLKTLGELDVEKREIARLEKITAGVVAGKVLLEREYSKQKLEAVLSAHREALLLHGLSSEQVDQIVTTRHLLSEMQVRAPVLHNGSGEVRLGDPIIRQISAASEGKNSEKIQAPAHPFVVQDLDVSKGQFVKAGDSLCVLADFRELYIEGRAFEHDADELALASSKKWDLTALREGNGKKPEVIRGLKLVYINNRVESNSRALLFYVGLPNEILSDSKGPDGRRFLIWRYRPGQRMQLQVPVEQWDKRIVLPVDAVAQEGAEYFVFVQNGDHFDRRPVHVEFRDQFSAVIANDGSLFPGDTVAFTGAHLMQMALKNKSGGGVDPHAGHTH